MSSIIMLVSKRGRDARTGEISLYEQGQTYTNVCPELKATFLDNLWAEDLGTLDEVIEEVSVDEIVEEVSADATSDDEIFEALDKMSKKELVDFAQKQGIDVDATKTKADLLKDVKTGYLERTL